MINSNFCFRERSFQTGKKTRIMGILNVTPDSFSDGGCFVDTEKAVSHALQMLKDGADVIDVGGESTRPGAPAVSVQEELDRVLPVIREIRNASKDAIISIDTTKPEVARSAIEAGADILNDVSGLKFNPEIANVAAEFNSGLILMHMRGNPATMQTMCNYKDLITEISEELEVSANSALSRGVPKENIMLDPGIGFAKNAEQNIEIMKNIAKFAKLGYPLLVGPSRKSFIGHIINESDPSKRIWGTGGAVAVLAVNKVDLIRVHDVKEMHDLLKVFDQCR